MMVSSFKFLKPTNMTNKISELDNKKPDLKQNIKYENHKG